jgi:hypothetical protein
MPMINALLYRAAFIENILRYLAENIPLLKTDSLGEDYSSPA